MLRERFDLAVTLDQFTDQAKANQALWRAIRRRAQAPLDLVERLRSLPARRYLLALTEDWCGDAVNTLPPVARLAEAVPQLELRVLPRDENVDVMDTHLTGTARAIPVVIVLDEEHRELGWWGPRPQPLQHWFKSEEAQQLSKDDRYRDMRRWYARDRGRTALEEITQLLERTARSDLQKLRTCAIQSSSASEADSPKVSAVVSGSGGPPRPSEPPAVPTWARAATTRSSPKSGECSQQPTLAFDCRL